MADDSGGKKSGEAAHSNGWEGPWYLLLGGLMLALLLVFAMGAPDTFCDGDPKISGETTAACVRGWLEALGPWIAIAVAWLALRPAYSQLSVLLQQSAIGALAVIDRNIDQIEEFRISLVRISDMAVDFRSRWRQRISNNLDLDIIRTLQSLSSDISLNEKIRTFSRMGHELKIFSSESIKDETLARFINCVTILRVIALHCTSDPGRNYLISEKFGTDKVELRTARDIDLLLISLLKSIEDLVGESSPDLHKMEDRRSLLQVTALGN